MGKCGSVGFNSEQVHFETEPESRLFDFDWKRFQTTDYKFKLCIA